MFARFRSVARHAFCLGAITLTGCASLDRFVPWGSDIPEKLDAKEVPQAIETARNLLAKGNAEDALDWMRAASHASGISTELRDQVQGVLESAADRRIQDLSAGGSDGEELADMLELGLPRQLAVTAAVSAARIMYERGDLMDAFRLIKKVDLKFPLHHERRATGDLLIEIGLQLEIERPGFLGIFSSTDDAQEVLEYAILNQPWAQRCDEAYATLARIYEEDREWELAIERNSGLVLNHPQSPLRPASQARIPHLRLESIKSVEYDRNQLKTARKEIEEWLRKYAGHDLEESVRVDLADCLRRLCESDLIIAQFYDTVDNPYGAHEHAARAVTEAADSGDPALVERSKAALDRFPAPAPSAPAPAAGKP